MNRSMRAWVARGIRGVAAIATVVALSGCASTLSANVTSFQQWPDDVVERTYTLSGPSDNKNHLEYSAYQDMLRAAISPTGLVEARDGQRARFLVSFHYESTATQVVRREPADRYGYGGFYGGWPWGWGGYYGWPLWVAVPYSAWRNSLIVTIRDASRDGAEVYRSTAATTSTSPDALLQVMPYLMRAVFDGFPGNNGQTRELQYRLD